MNLRKMETIKKKVLEPNKYNKYNLKIHWISLIADFKWKKIIINLEDRTIEITQSEGDREKRMKKMKRITEMCETIIVCGPKYMLFES